MAGVDYAGREQAWVKHWMLEQYLATLIMKVGSVWSSFIYIDAFAGPWKSQADDLSDTSFARALQVMRDCQAKHAAAGRDLPMRAIFCEKSPKRAARLSAYAMENDSPKLRIETHKGDFTEKVDAVAAGIGPQDFCLALVDPTAWVGAEALEPLLKKRGVEVMVNVMWDHANRFWQHPSTKQALDGAFGQDRAQQKGVMDGAQMYATQLRRVAGGVGGRLWSSSFPVQNPLKNRVHYFLVYATHSPRGLLAFDKVAESSWKVQAVAKATAKVRRGSVGMDDLFNCEVIDAKVERPVDIARIRQAWLDCLQQAGGERKISAEVMAGLIESCSCLEADLQLVLKQLCEERAVFNVSSGGRKRPSRAVHWEKNELLRLQL